MVAPVVMRRVSDGAVQIMKRFTIDSDLSLQQLDEHLMQDILGRRPVLQEGKGVRQQDGAVLFVEDPDPLVIELSSAHIASRYSRLLFLDTVDGRICLSASRALKFEAVHAGLGIPQQYPCHPCRFTSLRRHSCRSYRT